MSNVVQADWSKNRMIFDCESKKAMGIADGTYELRTNLSLIHI